MDLIKYEKKYWDEGFQKIVGIDEAGRGPLAGPVVAASVILKPYEIIKICHLNEPKTGRLSLCLMFQE